MLQKDSLHKYWALLILVLFPLLAFWQAGFMVYTLKWDAMDQFFQHQLFICECLGAGELPLWNPYQYFGSPFYADPQGGFWYPVYWLISAVSPCDARIINLSLLVHVVLGGIGMYKLLKGFGFNSTVVICFALAYECNGLFVSNAQHMPYVVVGAWLPFMFHYFLQLLRQPKVYNAIALGGVAALMLTGGYPAFAIIIAYFLVIFWVMEVISLLRNQAQKRLLVLCGYSAFAVVVALALSLGFIYSFAEALPLTVRHADLSMQQILFGAYTPQSLISTVLPYAVSADTARYASDTSMINGYMGLLTVVFLLPGLLFARFKYKRFFVIMAVIALAAAVGGALPVREWLANYLPGFDKFRFPSIFRAYWIMGAMVSGAGGLQHYFSIYSAKPSMIFPRQIIVLLILGLMGLVGFALAKGGTLSYPPLFNMAKFPAYYQQLHLTKLVLSQGILAIAFLALLYVVFWQRRFPVAGLLVVWVAVELLVSTQLNVPATIISHRKMERFLVQAEKLPSGFPLPTDKPLNTGFEIAADLWPSYYNHHSLHKVVGNTGFNPFQLKTSNGLNESDCIQTVMSNPLAFFDKGSGSVTWLGWKPGYMKLEVESAEGGRLVLSQAIYNGWEALVASELVTIKPYCDALVSVDVPKGSSEVVVSLEKPTVRALFGFTEVAFALWMIGMFIFWARTLKLR